MKKLAKIPSFLLSSELAASLKLENLHQIMIIPQSILTAAGIVSDIITFELVIEKGRLSLIGPDLTSDPRVSQSVVEESVT